MKAVKPEERKDTYAKNFAQLSPWLQDSVAEISEDELWKKVEVTYNAEGYPVCRYRRGDVWFHITSENPVREAEIWCGAFPRQSSTEVFLYGTGFGYALFALFERKLPHTLVIAFEQDLFLFKAMLTCFDFSPLLQSKKLLFLVGDSSFLKSALEELTSSLLFFSTTHPTVAFTLPAVRNFKKEYLEIHRYVFEELTLMTSYLGNDHQDNMIGLRNLASNAGAILGNPYLDCLRDNYKNVPAFIVSNGPSLDRSMPLLKKIQGKGLMIAVESSIVPLTKNGIKPDILAVLERTKYTYLYHFQGRNYSPDIALLALALVDPRVFPSFSGEKIPLFRKGEELNRWFNHALGNGSEIDAGSNVSHLAMGIALYLGADPIIFVGQDYAYGPGGVTHSRDAVASQEKGRRARSFLHSIPTVTVEGNNGEKIPSNQLWTEFRMILENKISRHPEHHFYNATVGGAKIRGTERAELSELIERYCTKPIPYRVSRLIAESKAGVSIAERRKLLEDFIPEVNSYASRFRSLAREMNLRSLECRKMMRLSGEKNPESYRSVLDDAYRKNLAAFYQYQEDSLCRSFFQQVSCSYFYLMNQLGYLDTCEKQAQAFYLQSRFSHDLGVISQSLAVSLEEIGESLRAAFRECAEKECEDDDRKDSSQPLCDYKK